MPLLLLAFAISLQAQEEKPVEVCDLNLPVTGLAEQELYYAFAAGDRMVIQFSEERSKADWEVEVSEYPDHVRLREYQVGEIAGRQLQVDRTAVYRFVIRNTSKRDRVCRLHLQRIPGAAATRNFSTAVDWVEQRDTVVLNTTSRMERRQVAERNRVLVSVDTSVVSLVDRTERVHSRGNISNSATSTIKAALPPNRPGSDAETELVSWAYWIGVGSEAEQQYQKANKAVNVAKSAANAAVKIGLLSSGYGALAVLAVEGASFFVNPPKGDNIKYRILGDGQLLDQGDGIAAFARQAKVTQGEITVELTNDNYVDAVNVQVRLVAVTVTRRYREEVTYVEREVPVFDTAVTVKRVPVVRQK